MGTAVRNIDGTHHDDSPWAFGQHDRLAKALTVSGVSHAEMADALDVSRNTIGNYIAGRTKPSRLQVKEWAVRTGAPLEWLLTGRESVGPEPTTSTVESGRFATVTSIHQAPSLKAHEHSTRKAN